VPDPKEQQPPQGAPRPRPASEPKPDPSVEAPAFVWVNKGYDPRTPNPGQVRKPKQPDPGEARPR